MFCLKVEIIGELVVKSPNGVCDLFDNGYSRIGSRKPPGRALQTANCLQRCS